MCWTLLHLPLLKMSGLPKTPGGGKITFDFIVRMLAGTNGLLLLLLSLYFTLVKLYKNKIYYEN